MPLTPRAAPADFLRRLLRHGLDIQSVWSVGHDVADGDAADAAVRWLLAFADRSTLERLRKCQDLHQGEIQLFVVVDGDAFENAWGSERLSGSLARWGWREVASGEAYYDESRWSEGEAGAVVRVRRRAHLVWTRAGELQHTA